MESFISNLKHQVQCSLCNETLIEPKLLQCFHTFCKSCIKRHAQLTEEVNIFKCPQCTSQTLLQELNEDLQTSPVHSRILQVLSFVENQRICSVSSSHSEVICHCLECDRSFCEECLANHSEFTQNHQVVALSDLKKVDIERMLKRESPCKTHDNQDVDLYCEHCDMLICVLCLKDHHRNHKTASLQEFIDIEKDLISKNLEAINKMNTDEKEKKQQEEQALLIKRDGEKAKEQLKQLTKKLIKALNDNEQQLLNEIQNTITKADKNLRIIRHTTEALEYIECFLQNGTASEMIDTRDGECLLNFTYNPFEKRISGIEFKPNEKLCEQMKTSLGLVESLFNKADPKMSLVKVEPSNIHAMNKARLSVELRTSEGEVTEESMENITIQFTPEDDVKVKEIQMTDDSKTITVDFIPRVAGQLTADIQVNGDSVSNSLLVMVVKPQQMKEMTGNSKLKDALNTGTKNFRGIALNKTNSKIAVADFASHCVRVFSMEGDVLLTYGSEGSGQGQLKYPLGLAFLNETYLIIADNDNHRICIVNTTTGKLVRTFGCLVNGNGQFNKPYGVHVDDDSNIIVCDCWNHRVQVFTKDGDYKYRFSVPYPYSTVTHNGLFYVSDNSNSVVHVIEMKDNQSPTTVTTIGGKDDTDGQLHKPRILAIDNDNNLLIEMKDNQSCTTVTTIGGKDYTDGQLRQPWGLAIDNDNNLLVCDRSLIHKFTLDGRYVGQSSELPNYPRYIAVWNDGQVFCTTNRGVRKLDNM